MRPRTTRSKSRTLLASALLTLASAPATAAAAELGPFAPDHPLEREMTKSQRIVLEAIALQPESLHPAIFEVVLNEGLLLRIPVLWSDFELTLQPILEPYSEPERAALQHLARHPGLLDALAKSAPHGDEALQLAVAEFPESVRELALIAGRDYEPLLSALDRHVDRAAVAFEALIAELPADRRQAFRDVIGRPQLTSLLFENLDVSQMLAGEARIDRAGTAERLLDLRRVVVRKEREAKERAERRRAAAEQARRAYEERERQRVAERRARRLAYWRSPYWGGGACWYADPYYARYSYLGRRHCWYPWHRYHRRWW